MDIEVGQAERPFQDKGHDRLVVLEDLGRFAIFDGAGQAMASEIAARTFREEHADTDESSLPFLHDVFTLIQAHILRFYDELPEAYKHLRGKILTTGTALGLRTLPNGSSILEYAHAGDSSLWAFDHGSDSLSKLTRDEIIGSDPYNCWPNVRNWLGAPEHQLEQWLGMPLTSEHLSLVLFSDGVGSYDAQEGAITRKRLEEILRSPTYTPESKANQIIQSSSVKDDASAIVVEVTK